MDRYPDALWVPAHPSNFRKGPRGSFDRVVIHCTDGGPRAESTAAMWQEPGHKSSAHFAVGQDGTVIQAVLLSDVAWHAHLANGRSVGIEHCARTPGELSRPGHEDPGLPPTEAQYAASARLVAWLCYFAGLRPDRDTIQGHYEIDDRTDHADCPNGCGWDWIHYMQLVSDEHAKLQEA